MEVLLQRAKQAREQPAVMQRYSVRALVTHVLQGRAMDGNALHVIRSLLSLSEVAMLDEVIHGAMLFLRAGKVTSDDVISEILMITPVAEGKCLRPLINGIANVMCYQLLASAGTPPTAWTKGPTHPFTKVLQARHHAQDDVLLAVNVLLSKRAPPCISETPAQHPSWQPAWGLAAIKAFVVHSLLDPAPPLARAAFPPVLHQHLIHAACCDDTLVVPIVQMLTSLLRFYQTLPGEVQGGVCLLSAVNSLVAVYQTWELPGLELRVPSLVHNLVQLCVDTRRAGGPLAGLLNALQTVAFRRRHLLQPHTSLLGLLLASSEQREEADLLLCLMATAMSDGARRCGEECALQLVTLPLLQSLSLPDAFSWKVRTLLTMIADASRPGSAALVHPQPGTHRHWEDTTDDVAHGEAALMGVVQQHVVSLWQGGCDGTSSTHETAHKLLDTLKIEFLAQANRKNSRSSVKNWQGPVALMPSLRMLLGALLHHPNCAVVQHTAKVLAVAAEAFPQEGFKFLPLVLFKMQSSQAAQTLQPQATSSQPQPHFTEHLSGSKMRLELMRTLASFGGHSSCTGAVMQALSPLAEPHAPVLMQAHALRLLCRVWQRNKRCFPQLKAALVARESHQVDSAVETRLARAACVLDVCVGDPVQGTELVLLVQEGLQDSAHGVATMALESLAALCEQDVVDFYTAWKVVRRFVPIMPQDALSGSQWLRLLGYGALDALVHEDTAKDLIDMLWTACQHSNEQIRQAAFDSLLEYGVDLVDTLQPVPLSRYTELYLKEPPQSTGAPAALRLLAGALQLEHARRRRVKNSVPSVSSGPGGSNLSKGVDILHPVASAVRRLCHGKLTHALPSSLLVCFVPELSTASSGAQDEHQTAKAAVKAYAAAFEDAVLQPLSPVSWNHFLLMVPALEAFLGRWLRAALALALHTTNSATTNPRKSGDQPCKPGNKPRSTAAWEAVDRVWVCVKTLMDNGAPAQKESAMLAAAVLCTLAPTDGHPNMRGIVQVITRSLEEIFASASTESAAGTAAIALGLIASSSGRAAQQLVDVLYSHIYDPTPVYGGAGFIARAGCAESLGLICCAAVQSELDNTCAEGTMLVAVDALRALLDLLGKCCPVLRPQLSCIEQAANPKFSHPLCWTEGNHDVQLPPRCDDADFGCVLQGALVGLGHVSSVASKLGGTELARSLTNLMRDILTAPDSTPRLWGSLRVGACAALPAAVTSAYTLQAILDLDVKKILLQLQERIESSEQDAPAACISLAALLELLLTRGYTAQASDVKRMMNAIADTLSTNEVSANLKAGAAVALANLLGARASLPGIRPLRTGGEAGGSIPAVDMDDKNDNMTEPVLQDARFAGLVKSSLKALEAAARAATDPKVRRGAESALGHLWAAIKPQGCAFGPRRMDLLSDTAGPTPANNSQEVGRSAQALAVLGEDSALRGLVQCMHDNMHTENLTSSASMDEHQLLLALGGLRQARRLPALNWGGMCRRLIRHPSQSVQREGAELAVAHMAGIPALADLVEECLGYAHFKTLGESAQAALIMRWPIILPILGWPKSFQILRELPSHILVWEKVGSPIRLQLWQSVAALVHQVEAFLDSRKDLLNTLATIMIHLLQPLRYFFNEKLIFASILQAVPVTQISGHGWDKFDIDSFIADESSSGHVREWPCALETLCTFPAADAKEVTSPEAPLESYLYATAALVRAGCLPAEDLIRGREWCLGIRESKWSKYPACKELAKSMLQVLALALEAVQEDSVKESWILDTAAAVPFCIWPEHALVLLSMLIAQWSPGLMQGGAKGFTCSMDNALSMLPGMVPYVLENSQWQSMAPRFIDNVSQWLGTTEERPIEVIRVAVACLTSMRACIPWEKWTVLAPIILA